MQYETDITVPVNMDNIKDFVDGLTGGNKLSSNCDDTVEIVTTIISTPECETPKYKNVQCCDYVTQTVHPNQKDNVIILPPGAISESGQMMLQRMGRKELWFIYISVAILTILFLASSLSGIRSTWYKNITRSKVNPYIIGILWVVSTVLSYTAIFMIWEHAKPDQIPIDFRISVYFLIGSFLSLLWSTVLFQANNIKLAVWISALIFVYQFWLFIYIWFIRPVAGVFIIPIIIMYGYLFYSMVHLASINGIII